MSRTTTDKGNDFESQVAELLERLRSAHPESVRVRHQPELTLNNGRRMRPDFEFSVSLPHKTDVYLIECQDRKRLRPDIVDKIGQLKTHSDRNLVMFVYRDKVGASVTAALASSGVLGLNLEQLQDYVLKLEHTLSNATPRTESWFAHSKQALGLDSQPVPGVNFPQRPLPRSIEQRSSPPYQTKTVRGDDGGGGYQTRG